LVPGVVLAGGRDGVLRTVSTGNGHSLWQYQTVRDYTTVNGVAAKGGSLGAPGRVVVNGVLFVGSGYVGAGNGIPGNALLAFSVQ
jgi:polyvinyl alcohol dehydrogenase (cytochrome)